VKVVALISWWEESPSWLAATVSSAAKLCDHVVAVDGAYSLMPGGTARSEPTQAETVLRTCDALDMGCTIVRPKDTWAGNEVEKRTFCFAECRNVVTPGEDWIIVLDGDDVLTQVPEDTRTKLELTDKDVAQVVLWDRETWVNEETAAAAVQFELPPHSTQQQRRIYRAAEEIVVAGAHYCYQARNGDQTSWYWGTNDHDLTPALALHDVRIEHRTKHRDKWRKGQANEYYERRNALNIETTAVRVMETAGGEVVKLA
jgi:hypothetical protein